MSAAPTLNPPRDLLPEAFGLGALPRHIIPVGLDKRPMVDTWKEWQVTLPGPQQVREWSKMNPPAWAVITGIQIIIIDFDGPQGNAVMEELKLDPHVQTPSGGHHVHFRAPVKGYVKTINSKSSKDWPHPNVDCRGKGGYAVTIGSNANGEYKQLRPFDEIYEFEVLPEAFRKLIVVEKEPSRPAETPKVQPITSRIEDRLINDALAKVSNNEGRNNSGFGLACQLRDNQFTYSDALGVMGRFASACPSTNAHGQHEPYSESEYRATLNQVYSTAAREPWTQSRSSKQDFHAARTPHFQKRVDEIVEASEQPILAVIEVSNRQLRDIARESLEALRTANNPPELFARSGFMVAVVRNEHGKQIITEVSEAALRGRLTRSANYVKRNHKGDLIDVHPPVPVVQDILSRPPGDWELLPLDGLAEAPVLRPDGSVLKEPGYDHATRLYYAPNPDLRIPEIAEYPTLDQVAVAKAIVLDPIAEFPFDGQASMANAVAAILTPIVKPAIKKPTPLAVISATAPGTGKSLIAEVVAVVATGRDAEMQSAPLEADEWRKQITTSLLSGSTLVIFDNVNQRLDSGELCRAITADTYADRLLRTNDAIRIPVQASWIATGNNVQVGGDMPRRCYWIRMDAKMSNPFLRDDFAHPNLKNYVLEHRGEILAALLTLARAWFVAGKPVPEVTPIGSFEEWTVMVGGILAHAGIHGFLGNSAEAYARADQDGVEWDLFFRTVNEVMNGEAFTASQLWDVMRDAGKDGSTDSAKKLRESLPSTLLDAQEKNGLFTRRLGKCLASLEGRRFGDDEVHVMRVGILHKVQRWKISMGVTKK